MAFVYLKYESDHEFKFISDLLKKLGIGTSTLTKSEIEDIGVLKLLSSVDKSKKARRSDIMKKLSA